MKFHFITLFPELIKPWLTSSIIGRAHDREIFSFETHQLRDFALDSHRSVDDVAYGGGGGMVLKIEPLARAVESIKSKSPLALVICFAPQGERLGISHIENLLLPPRRELIFICGHYEGIDHRFIEGWCDRVISIGDFIVSGGELPAVMLADALIRFCEGSLAAIRTREESFSLRNHGQRLLEYPHYTRPYDFEGLKVPTVLLSGDHAAIDSWRKQRSLEITRKVRPDLVEFDKTSNDSP